MRGVVDSQDLQLNISRETLQHNSQLRAIANKLEKKIKSELEKMRDNHRDEYEKFFEQFGRGLKFGIYQSYGMQKGHAQKYRGVEVETKLLPKVQVDVVITKVPVNLLVDTVKKALYTGSYGDGKIFLYNVENVIKVRTGEEGYDALQDEDYE